MTAIGRSPDSVRAEAASPDATAGAGPPGSARPIVLGGGAALAAGMGVGRFAYTPILPLMHAQAGLSASLGSALATANYAGYLAGALAGIAAPALLRSRLVLRVSLAVLVGTLLAMPASRDAGVWLAARLVAGVASALIFMVGANALLGGLRRHAHHLTGWGFGGVGAGIAASGALVLAVRSAGTWQDAWLGAAALTIVFAALAWPLRPGEVPAPVHQAGAATASRRWFMVLLSSYTLEGVGYIIAGTFLVAAIDESAPAWAGSTAWILAGLAALPSAALWAWLARTWSRPALLLAALVIQAAGVALPAVIGGVTAALISAALFGATFLGIATVALAIGAHLRVPRAVAILTTGYSAGQIAGPLLVTPLLQHGYHQALLVSAGIVALAAVAALVLRHRFPHHLGPLPSRLQAHPPAVPPTASRPPA
jgi:hypothetical protein